MKRTTAASMLLLALSMVPVAGALAGGDKKDSASASKEECCTAAANGCCAAGDAACCKMWDAMKGLEGTWEMTKGADGEGAGMEGGKVNYHLTSAKTTLVETLFPGTDHEMVTVYHMQGDKMVVTHYCAMGNQPEMTSTADSKPGHMVFAFSGGSNVDKNGDYMGALTLDVENNTLKHNWTHFSKGKAAEKATFEFKRVKS